MRNTFLIILTFMVLMALVACGNNKRTPEILKKPGIEPYKSTEIEAMILQPVTIKGNSKIFSFHAPEVAATIEVKVYGFEKGKAKTLLFGLADPLGPERKEPTYGIFVMEIKEDYAMGLTINNNASGTVMLNSDPLLLDIESPVFTEILLQEFREIEINQEIPVAILSYKEETPAQGFSLEDYFEPSQFEDTDFVQVITVTFSDEGL